MTIAKSTTSVEYRPIAGFPAYRVGNDGSIWSCWKCVGNKSGARGVHYILTNEWRLLRQARSAQGYRSVVLSHKPRNRTALVHRLVLETFVGPCPDGQQCRHLNDIQNDNRLANLCWGTPKENAGDRRRNGFTELSEEHKAKISRSLVGNNRRHLSGKGYCWHKGHRQWMVSMCGKYYGYFATEAEAARRASEIKEHLTRIT